MRKRLAVFIAAACLLTGCISVEDQSSKIRDLSFTVLKENEIPSELNERIEKEKEQPFMLTYSDKGRLYIARGYGRKDKSGYSVKVEKLYETEYSIVIDTQFVGPEKDGKTEEMTVYPYVVVELKEIGKEVLFQ